VPGRDDTTLIRRVFDPRLNRVYSRASSSSRSSIINDVRTCALTTAWSYFAPDLRKWNPAVSSCSCKWRANNIPRKTSQMVPQMGIRVRSKRTYWNDLVSHLYLHFLIFNLLYCCENALLIVYVSQSVNIFFSFQFYTIDLELQWLHYFCNSILLVLFSDSLWKIKEKQYVDDKIIALLYMTRFINNCRY